MKQELIDTTLDLYTISRHIGNHNHDFKKKYPEIFASLEENRPVKHKSVLKLLLDELSSIKKWLK